MSYIYKRFFLAIPTLFGLVLFIFFLVRVVPGDPALIYLGDFYTPEDYIAVQERYGLDKPVHMQLINYLSAIAKGDLGISTMTRRPVSHELKSNIVPTIILASTSIILALVFGLLLGVISAVYKNSIIDHLSRIFALIGVSMPVFWSGIVLLWLFSYYFGLFPSAGSGSLKHLVLPATALASRQIAIITRLTRSSLLNVLGEDYITTARSKGILESKVIFKHALKNAMLSITTMIGYQFGMLLGGSAITEIVFSRPGLGLILVESVFARDYPLIQGAILLFGILVIIVNFIIDLSYSFIDPRVRYD